MKGIWRLSTHLDGSSFADSPALARIVFNIVFIPWLVYIFLFAWNRGKTMLAISWGSGLLLLWYILNTIDLFLHESKVKVSYTYILYYFFLACLKFPADVFILAGSHRLIAGHLYLHHQTRKPKPVIWLLAGEFLYIMLAWITWYYVGTLLAYDVLLLQVADASGIISLGDKKNKIETAFMALQFILTVLTVVAACFGFEFTRRNRPTLFQAPTIVGKLKPLTAILAPLLLFIRSVSELVITARYHLGGHSYARSTLPARDLIYGLTTLGFLTLASSLGREIDDAEIADAENPLLADMKEDVRKEIIRVVEDHKRRCNGAAPRMAPILRDMRANPLSLLQPDTRRYFDGEADERAKVLEGQLETYIEQLEARHGALEERDLSREY